jgi:hypothetical protein
MWTPPINESGELTRGALSLILYSEYISSAEISRDGIIKLLKSPGIDSKESIPPAYVAWQAGTTILILLGSKPSIDCSKIPAQGPYL